MFQQILGNLKPPTFEDMEKSRIASLVHWLSWALMLSALLIGIVDFIVGVKSTLIAGLIIVALMGIVLSLARRGYIRMASYLLLLSILSVTTGVLALGNGIHDIAIILYPILIVIASFLLHRKGTLMMSMFVVISAGFIVTGEIYQFLPIVSKPVTRLADWIVVSVLLLIGASIIGFMSDTVVRAVHQAQENEQAYAVSNEMLRQQSALLAESEARWRNLVENAPINIINVDQQGNILFVNNAPPNEESNFIGRSIFDITPENEHEKIQKFMRQVFTEKKSARFESWGKDYRGKLRWYSVILSPIKDKNGAVSMATIIASDISNRLEFEQTIAENENKLRQRAELLNNLNEIGRAVASLRDLKGLLNVVFDKMKAILPFDAFFVALYDEESNKTSYPLMFDSGQFWDQENIALDPQSTTGKAILTGESILENRAREEVKRLSTDKYVIGDTNRISASIITVPLILNKKVVGVVSAHSYDFDVYNEEHLTLLTGAAFQIAIAIENTRLYEAQKQRSEQLASLNEIGRSIATLRDLDSSLKVTLEQLQKVLTLDVFFVGLYHPEINTVTFPIMFDSGQFWQEPESIVQPDGWIARILNTRQPFLLNRTHEEIASLTPNNAVGAIEKISASIMMVPMELEDRLVGVVSVHSYTLNAYNQEHIMLLSNAANQIAISIENAKLYQDAKQRADVMTTLYRMGTTITMNLQIDKVFNDLYQNCQNILPLDAFYIATYDPATGQIAHPIFYDKGKRMDVGPRNIKKTPGLSGYIITHKQTIYIDDVLDPKQQEKYQIIHVGGDPTRSYLGVPLMHQGEPIGVISIQNDQPGAYTPEHITLLETISTQATIALVNARLYEDLQTLNAELEERVEERTAELQAFTYTVSHDLRAPLRSINGYSRIFIEEYGDQIPKEGHVLLERIGGSARQMGMLIDDLLTFSRLNRTSLNKFKVDLTDLSRDIFQALTEHEDKSRINFEIANIPVAYADPMLLRQVLTNLIGNALKFTRHREQAHIEMGYREQDGETIYFIKDNGAGFNMDHANKLFGVFQRLHHQDEFEGTGVGLAIVQRIIQYHGGHIWAEAELDKGATFYFTLESQ